LTRDVALTALLSFVSVMIISAIITENADVEFKFFAVKAWATGHFPSFPANHHNLRWAINLPATLWVAIFGDSPASYLTLNYVIFSVSTAGIFWLARVLVSPTAAVLVFALWFLNPVVYWIAPLLMPELFSVFYLVLALILLHRGYTSGSHISYGFGLLSLFFMYGAKETNIFFIPGLALYELVKRDYKKLAMIISVFVVGLFLETTIVDILLRNNHIRFGRLEALLRSPHIAEMYEIFSHYTFADIPRRWWFTGVTNLDRLEYFSKATYFAFFAVSGWFIWRKFYTASLGVSSKDESTSETTFVMISLGLSFAFFTTFFIISWHPFILGQPLADRYLWVMLVPSILTIGAACDVIRAHRTGRFLVEGFQAPLTPILIAVIVIFGTLSRLAIDAGIVAKRRQGHVEPYTVLTANAYYRASVRERLQQGCTVIFAGRRAAWSGLIFAFPYGFFSEPERLYERDLNGLKIAGGGAVRGSDVDESNWIGLREIRAALGQTLDNPYALQFEGVSAPSCDRASYLGQLDVHPRDQELQHHVK
jgi:hypothetical protein